jgi:cell division protein ZipA
MPELRWILLGLGVLVIAVVYAWSRRRQRVTQQPQQRAEPGLSEDLGDAGAPEPVERGKAPSPQPDRIISLRLIAGEGKELNCEQMVVGLREAGLRHGRYGIFHRHSSDDMSAEPLFSVANLVEPGSFDLKKMKETALPGVSFFLLLPCPGDAVAAFDDMVETARRLAQELNADLFDDRGSSWSIQRERYLREEIIEYRRQKEFS